MRRLAGGRFDARPRTPARPRRIVFDGLVKAFKQWRSWRIGTIHEPLSTNLTVSRSSPMSALSLTDWPSTPLINSGGWKTH
jgi:hypothetical protein